MCQPSNYNVQVCMWSIDTWVKRKSVYLFLASGKAPVGATQVQFHCNQIHILVFHETQLAIYDASKLDLLQQVEIKFS